jgi:iron complex outermembrane receptor protein
MFYFSQSPVQAAVLALSAVAMLHSLHAQAQVNTNSVINEPAPTLKEVTVTGNPLGSSDLVAPTSALAGTALLLKRESTLGETLADTPGVSSTYFGPNASRPIIRGQDGDRIRILQNGGASIDASGLSFDHAVPMDPLTIERIEVLRGPGALLYGGSAVGGVVNVIDSRIPREALFDEKGGITGKADVGLSSADRGKNAGISLDTGSNRFGLHLDTSSRTNGDTRVPIELNCTRPGGIGLARRICNSAADTHSVSLGGSLFFDRGYVGASVTDYGSVYGTVAEDNVKIDMRSKRYALEGLVRVGNGLIESIKTQMSSSDYQHVELNAGVPQTTFKNKGNELRLEVRHAKFGSLEGMVGLQFENSQFSAVGAEAFAPFTRSANKALFVFEELGTGWGKLTFGGRLEKAAVTSDGNPTLARFVVGKRDFNLGSYALGGLLNLAPAWKLTSNLSYSERAPKDYELYANGPHGATGVYEVGNTQFEKERATSLDVGMQWKSGADRAALTGFISRFNNYIYLDRTGSTRDSDGNGAGGVGVTACGAPNDAVSVESGCTSRIQPEFSYRQVRARFSGLEANGNIRLFDKGRTVDLELRGDLLRADNLTIGQPLPRIAPARVGATLVLAEGPWQGRLGFNTTSLQSRVPVGQQPTNGYTLWNAVVTYRMQIATPTTGQVLWYARLDNAGNQLAYSATSILTQTVPGRSPLPGRSLKVGLQASF